MAAGLAGDLARATEVSGLVLFGVWPLALLARLAFRPQASNPGSHPDRGNGRGGIASRRFRLAAYHVWHGSLQAWADDVGPAAVALTRMDFFDRSNFGALVFHGRDKW